MWLWLRLGDRPSDAPRHCRGLFNGSNLSAILAEVCTLLNAFLVKCVFFAGTSLFCSVACCLLVVQCLVVSSNASD